MQKNNNKHVRHSQAEIEESLEKNFDKPNNLWNYLQNTTNETNVKMFMYKVYLTHFMYADDSIYSFCNC